MMYVISKVGPAQSAMHVRVIQLPENHALVEKIPTTFEREDWRTFEEAAEKHRGSDVKVHNLYVKKGKEPEMGRAIQENRFQELLRAHQKLDHMGTIS